MKTIILSFDDARIDTYTVAFPIMKKYKLVGTINVITQFVKRGNETTNFGSWKGIMSIKQLKECFEYGFEIASHGTCHNNNIENILESISDIKDWGFTGEKIGFASPHSDLTLEDKEYTDLVKMGILAYIRSGIQIRREGFIYEVLSWLERKSHSSYLFYWLNKNNIISSTASIEKEMHFYRGISITEYTTIQQIKYTIDRMKDGDTAIFILHSVLPKEKMSQVDGPWKWDSSRFEKLCMILHKEYNVCTMMDWLKN